MKTRSTVAIIVLCVGCLYLAGAVSAGVTDGDGDGMADDWETAFGLDPWDDDDAMEDPDGDGLSNEKEYEYGGDPLSGDSDGDGLLDGEEVARYGTSPAMADTDGGGRSDGHEVAVGGSPDNPDDDAAGTGVSISLQAGWNMFSVPLQPPVADVTSVLAPIAGEYKAVWAYSRGTWQCYDPANPALSDLERIEPGRGYWIHMRTAKRLTVSGTPVEATVPLYRGWNLVGYKAAHPQSVEKALEDSDCDLLSIWSFHLGYWRVYDPELPDPPFSDLTEFAPGIGYWIETRQDCQWKLP